MALPVVVELVDLVKYPKLLSELGKPAATAGPGEWKTIKAGDTVEAWARASKPQPPLEDGGYNEKNELYQEMMAKYAQQKVADIIFKIQAVVRGALPGYFNVEDASFLCLIKNVDAKTIPNDFLDSIPDAGHLTYIAARNVAAIIPAPAQAPAQEVKP